MTDVVGALNARNEHGEVVAEGVAGSVDASTSFAKLETRQCSSDLHLRNEHGGVIVHGGGGQVDVATTHGAIEIESPAPNIRCRNEHGKIQIVSTNSTFQLIDAETSFGNLDVRVLDGAAPVIGAGTEHGEIDSDFPVLQLNSAIDNLAESGPRMTLKNSHGDIVMVLHGRNAIKTKRIRSKHGKVTKGKGAVAAGKLFVGVGGVMTAAGSLMLLFKGGMLLLSSVGGSQAAQQDVPPRSTEYQKITQRPTPNNPTANVTNPFGAKSSNDNTGTTIVKTGTNANGSATSPPAVIPTVVKPPATTKLATATDDALRPIQSMSQEKAVNSLAFSPDGKLLLSADGQRFGSADSSPWHAYIWDVASGQLRQKMDLQNPADRVRFAPGGRLVAVSKPTPFRPTLSRAHQKSCTARSSENTNMEPDFLPSQRNG